MNKESGVSTKMQNLQRRLNATRTGIEVTVRGSDLMRKFGKGVWQTIFPYHITPYEAPDWVKELQRSPSKNANIFSKSSRRSKATPQPETNPVVVTFSRDNETVSFRDTHHRRLPAYEDASLEGKGEWTIQRFAKLLINSDMGEYTFDELAELSGYKERTVASVSDRIASKLPEELFSMQRELDGDFIVTIGNISLAQEWLPPSRETDRGLPENAEYEMPVETIEVEATLPLHAVVSISHHEKRKRYHVGLNSRREVVAARTINTLASMEGPGHSLDSITQAVWDNMADDEKQLYARDTSVAIKPTVANLLRKTTNRLMLTREPKNGVFSILPNNVLVTYGNEPDCGLKPDAGIVSAELFEQAKYEPDITEAAKQRLVAEAKKYTGYARDKVNHGQEETYRMISFLNSKDGRWALRQIVGTEDNYANMPNAIRYLQLYIEDCLPDAFRAAERENHIAGAYTAGRSRARTTAGILPDDTRFDAKAPERIVRKRYRQSPPPSKY